MDAVFARVGATSMRKSLLRPATQALAATCLSLALAPVAQAQSTIKWVAGSDGMWNNALNWDLGRSPGFNDDVVNTTSYKTTLTTFAEIGSLTSTGAFEMFGYLKGSRGHDSLITVDNDFFVRGRLEALNVVGTGNTRLVMVPAGGGLPSFDRVLFTGSTVIDFNTTGADFIDSALLGTTSLVGDFARLFGTNQIDGTTTIRGTNLLGASSSPNNLVLNAGGSLSGNGAINPNWSRYTNVINNGRIEATQSSLTVLGEWLSGEGTWSASPGATLVLDSVMGLVGNGQGGRILNNGGSANVYGRMYGHFREAEFVAQGTTISAYFERATISGGAKFVDATFAGPTVFRDFGHSVLGNLVLNGPTAFEGVGQLKVFAGGSITIGEDGSLVTSGTIIRSHPASYLNSSGEIRSSGGNLYIGTYSNTVSGLQQADPGTTLYFDGPVSQTGGTTRALGQVWAQYGIDLYGGRLEGGEVFGLSGVRNHGGTIAPGVDGVGTMTVLYDITFGRNSTFEVDINGLGQSDLLLGTNYAFLDGTLEILSSPTSRFATGQRFRILQTNNWQYGRFAVEPDRSQWIVHYGDRWVDVEAVPEPSSLVAVGLGALSFLRRRKRS